MRRTLYMFRGLPASGKSTKRREMLADANLQPIVCVNKDDIRTEKGIIPGNFSREKEVLAVESAQIAAAIRSGSNIIVDNTHNSPKYLQKYKELAKANDYTFVLIDLSDVPVEECIRRDALRTGREHVGEAKIVEMYNQFYNKTGVPLKQSKTVQPQPAKKNRNEARPRPTILEQDPSLPRALIVDLDGTLALANGRSWYEYSKCESDDLVHVVRDIVSAILQSGLVEHVIFLTGREDSGQTAGIRWLEDTASFTFDRMTPKNGPVYRLHMKATGDHRPDVETKRDIFDTHVRGKFFVLAVLEDRTKVVQMWREMGLVCFQVANGDY